MLETVSECKCRYVIDTEDRLIDVDAGWCAFALANHGESMLPDRVLGRSLWNFIAGMDNRLIYSRLLESVRARPRVLSFPFRCDAPAVRRDLRMKVEPGPRRTVRFTTEVLDEHARGTVHLLDVTRRHGESIVLMCSWCMRVEIELRRWVGIEEAEHRVTGGVSGVYPQVVHTICPVCADRMKRVIQD